MPGGSQMSFAVPTLAVTGIAGIREQQGSIRHFGSALDGTLLPRAKLRRLSSYERNLIACLMGLGGRAQTETIVFASRYGNIAYMRMLLGQIIDNDLLSPTLFSLSVHNAAVGVCSQLTGNRSGHTAIAAGADSLAAGLIESASRLLAGEKEAILLYADAALPEEYSAFQPAPAGTFLACSLSLQAPDSTPSLTVTADTEGATALMGFLRPVETTT